MFNMLSEEMKVVLRNAEAGDSKAIEEMSNYYVKMVEADREQNKRWRGVDNCVDEKLTSKMIKWVRKSAEAGNGDGMSRLAGFYEHGVFYGSEAARSLGGLWYCLCFGGMTMAGCFFLVFGLLGVDMDSSGALPLLLMGFVPGLAYGIHFVKTSRFAGVLVKRDPAEAMRWYRQAAEAGNVAAMFTLASRYDRGEGVEKNIAEAVKWYRQAAEAGDADAMVNLGNCYANGDIEKDLAESVKWYRQAAEAGNSAAMFNLGNRYYKGEGVEQDFTEAVKWYRQAAEAGIPTAMYWLSYCYHSGKGVEQDFAEAAKWLRNAADAGDQTAKGALERLEKQL